MSVPSARIAPALDPELIVTNMHRRHTGVSSTIEALLPVQARMFQLSLVGRSLPCAEAQGLRQAFAVSRRPPATRPFRIWHVRRNSEMLAALFARDVMRLPIRIVFTSAARRAHSLAPRWLISRMDAVVATTRAAAKQVPHVAAVIPHGVDVARYAPPADKPSAWAESGLPGRYGIGIFGRVRPQKGTDLFVQAMIRLLPRFPDFTAVVIGQVRAAQAPWQHALERQIAKAGLAHRIVFLGEVSPAETVAWLRRMLIVVAPARREEFGLTPLEGMASGAAVVASRTGAFEELVVPGTTGTLIPVDDVTALIAALERLMADPDAARTMGAAGRARAVEKFNIEHEAAALARVYAQLWAGEKF